MPSTTRLLGLVALAAVVIGRGQRDLAARELFPPRVPDAAASGSREGREPPAAPLPMPSGVVSAAYQAEPPAEQPLSAPVQTPRAVATADSPSTPPALKTCPEGTCGAGVSPAQAAGTAAPQNGGLDLGQAPNAHSAAQPIAAPATPPAATVAPPHESAVPLGVGSRAHPSGGAPAVGAMPAVATVASSLGVVLGLFLLLAWGLRRASPRGLVALPGTVFEVLGRAPLAGRQQVHLVRCGNKLLLVSITPAGTETLTEVTDPVEVDRLAGLCGQAHPKSATAAFRQIFHQFAPRNPGRDSRAWEESDV